MNARRVWKFFLFVAAVSIEADAQQLPSVIQLPSFRTFSYSGSVVVPDGGSAFLGGNKSSSVASSRRGLSRAFGSSQGISQASVTATIIDLDEMDRQILGATPKEFVKSSRAVSPQALDPTEEGKALVRHARRQYRGGKQAAAFDTYRMAIGVLSGQLQQLARAEFRRVFGPAAEQALQLPTAGIRTRVPYRFYPESEL